MILMNCRNLTLGYDHPLIRDLSFTVHSGDYLCVLGPNGAGKSTLLRTLLGLQRPLEGSVTLSGGVRANEIGYLPQQTQAQRDFPATVWEVTLSGCQSRCGLRPFYNRAEKEMARQALRRMGMEGVSSRSYRQLSGGQQQRVLLARALCAAGRMLLLDEPATGLDPGARREFYQAVAQLNQEEGVTILMISHDVQAALESASHVLCLGGQVFFGTKEAFLRREQGGPSPEEEGGRTHGDTG